MAPRHRTRPTGTSLAGSAALIVVSLVFLAAMTSLFFTTLAGSLLGGLAAGLGALPPVLIAIGLLPVAASLWRRWR